jgi:predicted RNA binding protein YcfA (HicA-like mRNA interferase family)
MKLPRDISGDRLVRVLLGLGYVVVRQKGSHVPWATAGARGRADAP